MSSKSSATRSGGTAAVAIPHHKRGCCSWRLLCGVPLLSVVVVFIAIVAAKRGLLPHQDSDKQWGLMTSHVNIVNPPAVHARYRMSEYDHLDVYFFQWWNFLVFDGETREHFNLIIHLTNFSSASSSTDMVSVRMGHLRSTERVNVVMDTRALSAAKVTRHADIAVTTAEGNTPYIMTFDDDVIRVKATFPAEYSLDNTYTDMDLTFARIHGVYLNSASEHSNHESHNGCLVVSNLFGYNSYVHGYIRENSTTTNFDTNNVGVKGKLGQGNRYRAYAAGSWGCQLPSGNPPFHYPWTWFWLIIPSALINHPDFAANKNNVNTDLSFVFGTAKFQTGVIGDLYGTYSITGGLPKTPLSASSSTSPATTHVLSTQNVWIFHNSSIEMPLISSTSDTHVSTYHVELKQWETFTDEFGSSLIPLQQIYTVRTRCYHILVHFHSKVAQYFRAPVSIEKDNQERVFSDFRAVGVTTDVEVKLRAECRASLNRDGNDDKNVEDEIIYHGTIDSMNALEFAYEPDMDIAKYTELVGKLRDLQMKSATMSTEQVESSVLDGLPLLRWFLIFFVLLYLWEMYLDYRQSRLFFVKQKPKELTFVTDDDFNKAQVYGQDKSRMGMLVAAINSTYMFVLMWINGYAVLWKLAKFIVSWSGVPAYFSLSPTSVELLCSCVFLSVDNVIDTAIGLLPSLYSTFVIEERHGFNKQTIALFFTDMIKGMGLHTLIGWPLLSVLLLVIMWGGPYFYIYVCITIAIIQLLAIIIYPNFIQPCFNKVEPLPEGELRTAIEKLAAMLQFPLKKLYVIDGSKRSTHSNAYFYGFCSWKHIVLFDTLIEKSSVAEVLAVLSHELGHWKLSHNLKNMIAMQLMTIAQFWLFGTVVRSRHLFEEFGFTNETPTFIGLMLFSCIYSPVSHVLTFLMNLLSRHFEFQADAFAVSLGHADTLKSGLVSLHRENKGTMIPDSWYSAYHHSHPPLLERLHAIDQERQILHGKKKQ